MAAQNDGNAVDGIRGNAKIEPGQQCGAKMSISDMVRFLDAMTC